MNEEKIIKLLSSNNDDDQLLGVTLAVSLLGKEWCKNNLIKHGYACCEFFLLDYGEFGVFFGSSYIEYIEGSRKIDVEESTSVKKINCKNDKIKELSES